MKGFITVKEPASVETVIKKSRFIGQVYPVSSMEEAQERLLSVKKKYWDARHSCSAVIVGEGGEYTRCSDDGEPQGTAGVPMLEALKGSGLTNVLTVVTRYFGGVLLGAGGLVRAYSSSVSAVCAAAKRLEYMPCALYDLNIPFKLWGKMEGGVYSCGGFFKEITYAEDIKTKILIPPESEGVLLKTVREISSGRLEAQRQGDEYRIAEL